MSFADAADSLRYALEEIREYGHRESIYAPGNVDVPWDELPVESRTTITAGETTDGEEATDATDSDERGEIAADVTDRLADLGYVN